MSERLYIHLIKSAFAAPSPYNPGMYPQPSVFAPYTPGGMTPYSNGWAQAAGFDDTPAAPQQPDTGIDWGEIGKDALMGTNPITGTYHFGGKAFNAFRNGNWGSGLANLGWLAASFFGPGASLARGLAAGGLKAVGARIGANAAGKAMTTAGKFVAPTAAAKQVSSVAINPMTGQAARSAPQAAGSVSRLKAMAPTAGAMGFQQITKPLDPVVQPPTTPTRTGSMSETMARITAGNQFQ